MEHLQCLTDCACDATRRLRRRAGELNCLALAALARGQTGPVEEMVTSLEAIDRLLGVFVARLRAKTKHRHPGRRVCG